MKPNIEKKQTLTKPLHKTLKTIQQAINNLNTNHYNKTLNEPLKTNINNKPLKTNRS